MDKKEKDNIKLKLAASISKILKKNKRIIEENQAKNVEDPLLVDNLRQLEALSGLSYTIIQTTSVGERDLQFSTLITLIESLKITFVEFASVYDKLTEKDLEDTKAEIDARKKKQAPPNKKKK